MVVVQLVKHGVMQLNSRYRMTIQTPVNQSKTNNDNIWDVITPNHGNQCSTALPASDFGETIPVVIHTSD